jgi:hypothetical protein
VDLAAVFLLSLLGGYYFAITWRLTAVDEIKRAQWVVTAAYSLALGPIVALFPNLVTSRRWALRRSVEGLDKLLLKAQEQALPVSFTLNSGKIYIGVVVDTGQSPLR